MLKNARIRVLVLVMTLASAAFAAADPTMHEVYEAAQGGHLAQAQQMIEQVLRDHPTSAKAHYVAAEIYSREGKLTTARQELTTAQSLQPGLSFVTPQSLQALERQLAEPRALGAASEGAARSPFPWGTVLLLVGGGLVLWAIFRRRRAASPPAYYPGTAPGGYGTSGYGVPGMAGGGIGSGIAGGLASGLAVGAGVVAGEELAHHFLDSNRSSGGIIPSADAATPPENGDMGGNDFGISDGGSWDDSGGGSFGGDDWS